jgi:hypothetical protein
MEAARNLGKELKTYRKIRVKKVVNIEDGQTAN